MMTPPPPEHTPGQTSLSRRRSWVFDLDHTLYPPEARLFVQIEARMTAYVAQALSVPEAEADRLRRHYWAQYGATLAGLMQEHGIDPQPYLHAVHDIDLDHLRPDPALFDAIAALPGRRIVHTNASGAYAARVLSALGLAPLFEAVYGVEAAGYHPKPQRAAFEAVFGQAGIAGSEAVMFEDDPRNLAVPHQMGLATVLVAPEPTGHGHIHYHTDNLTRFLRALPD
jgi:putative hydrolase of the HAD superfamily